MAAPVTNGIIKDPGSLHVSALSSLAWFSLVVSCRMAASSNTVYVLLLVNLIDRRDPLPIAQY